MTDPVTQLLQANPALPANEIRAEYNELREIGVPEQGAINTIRKRRGLPLLAVAAAPAAVTIDATILSRNESGSRLWGHVDVDGARVAYTAFVQLPDEGAVIRAHGAQQGQYKDKPTYTFGRGCTIEIVAEPMPAPLVAIGSLQEGDRATVEGRILESKQLTRRDSKPFWVGAIGDATGSIEWQSWDRDPGLAENQDARIENATITTYQGRLKLQIGKNTAVKPPAAPVPETVMNKSPVQTLTIPRARDVGEAFGVRIVGLVVDVIIDSSGIVLKCGAPQEGRPPCGRALTGDVCKEHGVREGEPDLRIKAMLDDGEASLPFFLDRERSEKLLGKTLEEILANPQALLKPRKPAQLAEQLLLGRRLAVTGRLRDGAYEPQLFADDFEFVALETKPMLAEAQAALGVA